MIDTASILLSCLLLVYVAYKAATLDTDERRFGAVPARKRTEEEEDVRPNRSRSERAP